MYGEPQCLVALSVDEVHETARALAAGVDFALDTPPRRTQRRDPVDPDPS